MGVNRNPIADFKLFPQTEFEVLVRETKADRHARWFSPWGQLVPCSFICLSAAENESNGYRRQDRDWRYPAVCQMALGHTLACGFELTLKNCFRSRSSRWISIKLYRTRGLNPRVRPKGRAAASPLWIPHRLCARLKRRGLH